MLQALQTATAPETLSVCPVVRGLVVDSLFPTLDRIAQVERAGGPQPGVGEAALPPGVVSPGGCGGVAARVFQWLFLRWCFFC